MTIQSIYELFIFDGEEFVAAAYKNLLSREPDEHGLAYYTGRLSLGCGKESIIAQIAKSPECRTCHDIKHLKQLISEVQRSRHWFWSLFTRDKQKHDFMQSNLNMLARIRQNINSLQDALSIQSQQTNAFTQQIVELTQQLVSYSPSLQSDETQRLSDDVVRQCFVEILGREPENEEIIKHYACLPTQKVLQEKLIQSEEFQHKLFTLSEYARHIFQIQIKMKNSNMENNLCV